MAAQKLLGELLVEMRFIDERQLAQALGEQQRTGLRLGKILLEMGIITEDRLTRALARQLGIETCAPLSTPIHPKVLGVVPAELALVYHVLPMALKREEVGQTLVVATADPLDRAALEALRAHLGATIRVRWLLAGETEIDLALARYYSSEPPRFSGQSASHFPPEPGNGHAPPSRPPVITGVPVSGPRNPAIAARRAAESGDLLVAAPPRRLADSGDLPPPSAPPARRGVESSDLVPPVPSPPVRRVAESGDLVLAPPPAASLSSASAPPAEPVRRWAPPPEPAGHAPVAPAAFGEPLRAPEQHDDAVLLPDEVIEEAMLLEDLPLQAPPLARPVEPLPRTASGSSPEPPPMSGSWGDLVLSSDDATLPDPQASDLPELELAETTRPAVVDQAGFDLSMEDSSLADGPALELAAPDNGAGDAWTEAMAQAIQHVSRDLPPPEDPSWTGMQQVEAAAEDLPDASADFTNIESSGPVFLPAPPETPAPVVSPPAAPAAVSPPAPPPPPEAPPLADPVASGAPEPRPMARPAPEEVRRALIAFLQNEPLQPELERFLMRTMAAMFLNEGFLDGDRLERALAKVR